MKKIVLIVVTLLLVVSLSACSTQNENNNDTISKNDIVESNVETTNPSNDDMIIKNDRISLEDVLSAKATPVSEFEYVIIDGGVSITKYNGNSDIISIPDVIETSSVLTIGKGAFANNTSIRGLKLSDTIIEIEKNAFANCSELEFFVSGQSLKKIGEYAFNACNSMKEVVLNEGLENLEISCLNSESLMQIEVPSTVSFLNRPFCLFDKSTRTIIAEKGSPAETFAIESGYNYEEK